MSFFGTSDPTPTQISPVQERRGGERGEERHRERERDTQRERERETQRERERERERQTEEREREREGGRESKSNQIKSKCICIALFTRKHVTEGFTYAHKNCSSTNLNPQGRQGKTTRKTQCKRKNGRNLGRSNSVRDPLLQKRLVKEEQNTG